MHILGAQRAVEGKGIGKGYQPQLGQGHEQPILPNREFERLFCHTHGSFRFCFRFCCPFLLQVNQWV